MKSRVEKKEKKEKQRVKHKNLQNFKINHEPQPPSYLNNVLSDFLK